MPKSTLQDEHGTNWLVDYDPCVKDTGMGGPVTAVKYTNQETGQSLTHTVFGIHPLSPDILARGLRQARLGAGEPDSKLWDHVYRDERTGVYFYIAAMDASPQEVPNGKQKYWVFDPESGRKFEICEEPWHMAPDPAHLKRMVKKATTAGGR